MKNHNDNSVKLEDKCVSREARPIWGFDPGSTEMANQDSCGWCEHSWDKDWWWSWHFPDNNFWRTTVTGIGTDPRTHLGSLEISCYAPFITCMWHCKIKTIIDNVLSKIHWALNCIYYSHGLVVGLCLKKHVSLCETPKRGGDWGEPKSWIRDSRKKKDHKVNPGLKWTNIS